MKFETESEGQILIVRPTRVGRALDGLWRGLRILPWSLGIAGFFFGLEYVGGRLTGTAQPSWAYLFVGLLMGLAVAMMFGVSRGLREDLWAFDLSEGVVAWESRMPWGQLRSVQVPLSDLRRVWVDEGAGRIDMEFMTGDRETLCVCRERANLAQVFEALRGHLGKRVEWS
jgi:hypothetical protein